MKFDAEKYEDLSDEEKQYFKSGAEMLNSINKKSKEMAMGFLTRAQIISIEDIKQEAVEVPEWGGDVMVRALTGFERDAFEASLMDHKKSGNTVKLDNIRAKLVQKSVIDTETGKPLFTIGDIDALGEKSAAALDRIFTVARKLSGLSEDDIEDLEKN